MKFGKLGEQTYTNQIDTKARSTGPWPPVFPFPAKVDRAALEILQATHTAERQ